MSLFEHLEGPAHVCEVEHLEGPARVCEAEYLEGSAHVCEVVFDVLLQCVNELLAFSVCRFAVGLARSHELAEKARTNEDRARCAAMLGVLWPRALHKRRRPGRPSHQETLEVRLYRAIHHGTILEDMTSSVMVMPKWWRPSLPLNVSEAEAEGIAGKLVDVQHAPEKEEPSESPSKRVKIHHCAEVKD